MAMKTTIISPEKVLFEGDVQRIKVPGAQGAFEILNNHAPIISILSKGKVECLGDSNFEIVITSGFVEVVDNKVSICVEL